MRVSQLISRLSEVESKFGGDIEVYITVKVSDDRVKEFKDIGISMESLEGGLVYCSISNGGK